MTPEQKESFKYIEIARQIPTGRRNIDRMREDIHCTVTSVLGLLPEHRHMAIAHKSKDANGYSWHISRDKSGRFGVYCIYDKSGACEVVYSNERGYKVHLEHVVRVYEVLGIFVESMHELFPGISNKLKPLLEAANVNRELFV